VVRRDGQIDEPFLTSLALLAIDILEVLDSPQIQRFGFVNNLWVDELNNLFVNTREVGAWLPN